MQRRHPKENWIGIRYALNNQITMYLRVEFVDWIDEVYLKNGKVFIKAEGFKWLYEKYFRTSYLKKLEEYKLKLTQIQELRKET